MLRTLSNILDILTMAVAALGSISLLVGGVGIVTIMTIAVAERTSEIGLLVALGRSVPPCCGYFSAKRSCFRRWVEYLAWRSVSRSRSWCGLRCQPCRSIPL